MNLESWKNQSESRKSPGNFISEKGYESCFMEVDLILCLALAASLVNVIICKKIQKLNF